MKKISRREFIKRTASSGIIGGLTLSGFKKYAQASQKNKPPGATIIDLSLCNGCPDSSTPRCVMSCRKENSNKFPVPSKEISDYWPQNKKEDWLGKKHITDRLTPYNWLIIQQVKVSHNGKTYELFIPRRCMHCTNPPCANLCPFSAMKSTPEGAVVINHDLCMGGAKCRDVCPWGIPARQAGVGLYMKIAPKYVGGGVMYKCDFCYHRLSAGKKPACVEACPRGVFSYGPAGEMIVAVKERARLINGYIYGEKENGGTSTYYISPVPFEKIHTTLLRQKSKQPNASLSGYPGMEPGVSNFLDSANGIAGAILAAPVAGAVAAGFAAYKTMKGDDFNG